jgi:hypothetical protein
MILSGPILVHAKLLMALNGLILAHEKSYRWLCMGPFLPMRNTADDYGCAHPGSWSKLPVALNGPILAYEKSCRCPGMVPFLPMRKVADDL